MAAPGRAPARERILDTAYELFSHNGIRAVGIDRIVAESGVAKMSLYHHFPSKDDLVLAFLELRMERWTRGWLEAEIERRAETPRERLLAVFDVFDEWFHESDFEGCSFILTLMEGGP
jgi:AcrR family transcriptional regulator